MKICILTQPLRTNYGGIMQALALQSILRSLGHEVVTLRINPDLGFPTGIQSCILTARRFLSRHLKGNNSIIRYNVRKQADWVFKEIDRFILQHIRQIVVNPPVQENSLPAFDVYIVGSDQVWRPAYSPYLPNFFLDFVTAPNVKRMAYAASFGVDEWELTDEMTNMVRPLAQKFDSITVREESAVGLCEKYLHVKAEVMPDPTLLLGKQDYLPLCGLDRSEDKQYIAAYILDKTDEKAAFINGFAESRRLPVKYIGNMDWISGCDSVESWLAGIAESSFVITDSFHGTVFSLIFEKPFWTIKNDERGAARFDTLLKNVGLSSRLISAADLRNYNYSNSKIDYSSVSNELASIRERGRTFLASI